MAAPGDQRLAGGHRILDRLAEIEALPAQFDEAAIEAGDFEQIVDQADEMIDLARHGFAQARRLLALDARTQNVQTSANRRQRVAQFMGEHGQKLVLAAVGLAQRFLGLLEPGDVAAHRGQADLLAIRIAEHEDVVDHPDAFAGLEMAEADFGFGAPLPEHARKEIVDDEILVLGKKEGLNRRFAELLDMVEANETAAGFVHVEGLERHVAHADEGRAVVRQQSEERFDEHVWPLSRLMSGSPLAQKAARRNQGIAQFPA